MKIGKFKIFSVLIFLFFNSLSIADECESFEEALNFSGQWGRNIPKYDNKLRTLTILFVELNDGFISDVKLKLNETEKFEIIAQSELTQIVPESKNDYENVKYNYESRMLSISLVRANDSFIKNVKLKLNHLGQFKILDYSQNNCENRVTLNKYNLIDSSMSLEKLYTIPGLTRSGFDINPIIDSHLIHRRAWSDYEHGYVLPKISVEFRHGRVIKKSYEDIFKNKIFEKFSNSFCDEHPRAPVCLNPSLVNVLRCDDFPMPKACSTPEVDITIPVLCDKVPHLPFCSAKNLSNI